jgi:hypothetical protein
MTVGSLGMAADQSDADALTGFQRRSHHCQRHRRIF